MFLISFVVLIFVILSVMTAWWYYIFYYYKRYLKGFAVCEQVPILGITYNVHTTVSIYNVLLEKFKVTGSKNMYGMLGLFPTLFTADPKLFSLILKNPKWINKPSIYRFMENVIGNSLLLVNGSEWRHQRKLLSPALDYTNVMNNIPIFNDQSDDLILKLAGEVNMESTELDGFLEYWSLIQSYESMLGGDMPLKDKIKFLEDIKHLMKIAMDRIIRFNEYFNLTYVFCKNYWVERKCLKTVSKHITHVLGRKRKELEGGNVKRDKPILIDILLKQMEIDENVTQAFIMKQLTLMIVAGFDTTAMSVCFALYNMAKYPEIQEKAYREVFSILGDDINQPITHQHIKEMTYLDLVIKESMRVKTSVPLFMRQLDDNLDYEGTILPKGLSIMFMPYIMNLDPQLYPDPENFIPERFLPENLNENKYSYVPFCAGVRNCIGQRYAVLAMKVVIAKILLNYKLVDVKHELCLACEITLRSKTGIRVAFRERN